MRVVVTGGSGFVGRHVLAALAAKDHVALPLGGPHDRGTMPSADIRDADALEAAIGDLAPDILIHLAGNAFVPDARAHPLDALATNGMGAANVLEAVRRLDLDPVRSAFLGDYLRDMQAAQAGGIGKCLWLTQENPAVPQGVKVVSDYGAALAILSA